MSNLLTSAINALPLPKQNAELSIQQAAEMMGVSHFYFIKLLEQGDIPYRKVGKHPRLRYQDLLTYLDSYQRQTTAILNTMSVEMQAMHLYD